MNGSLATLEEGYAAFLDLSSRMAAQFNATMSFGVQPWTSSAVRRGIETGGNPLGLKINHRIFSTHYLGLSSGVDCQEFLVLDTLLTLCSLHRGQRCHSMD
jgi:hypothetical protein